MVRSILIFAYNILKILCKADSWTIIKLSGMPFKQEWSLLQPLQRIRSSALAAPQFPLLGNRNLTKKSNKHFFLTQNLLLQTLLLLYFKAEILHTRIATLHRSALFLQFFVNQTKIVKVNVWYRKSKPRSLTFM